MTPALPDYCAIDFGTSNSALAVGDSAAPGGMRLVALEDDQTTMPTAVFYDSEDGSRRFGRAAVAAYVEGHEGRLMRSLKSILGSALVDETTHLGDGISVRYLDVIATFLKRMKDIAEAAHGHTLRRVVMGRPVYFVDDDPAADGRAEAALREAARLVGFDEVSFQFEPVAAARDYEAQLDRGRSDGVSANEERPTDERLVGGRFADERLANERLANERLVLVADIGGGTSDFTVIRIGGRGLDRSREVLANHGVHVAGTDFDRQVDLDAILPLLGLHGRTPEGREVPNRVYHDLATWHLINGVYTPRRVAELKAMRWFYADPDHHRRLMRVVEHRLGHRLMGRAEQTKIALSQAEHAAIDLGDVEEHLATDFDRERLGRSLASSLQAIVSAADETVRRAGVAPESIGALYFTGGSTGLAALSTRLSAAFPEAECVFGDRYASVAAGLAIEAKARYGSDG